MSQDQIVAEHPRPSPEVLLRRKRWLCVISLVFLAVLFDQGTKIVAQKHLMVWSHETDRAMYQGSRKQILLLGNDMPSSAELNSFLQVSFNYVRNPGAAWGSFAKMPAKVREPFFYVLTAIALGVIVYFLKLTPWSNRLARNALYLVFSGAAGNFLDRLRLGFVIDWLDLRWRIGGWRYNFPAFNAADVYISVGVAMLAFDLIVREPRRKRMATAPSQATDSPPPSGDA